MNLTKLEKDLILKITAESFSTSESLDFSKDWENGDYPFEDVCHIKGMAERFGMNQKTVKGVIGSLTKKGLISVFDDQIDHKRLWIDEEQFYQIKKLLNK
jgi:DNA-binding MarR family transcriptional regulator